MDVVLNARVDVFLRGGEVDEAVRRGRLYAEAGADCVYPIGVRGRDAIRRLVEEVGAPVNILAVPGGLSLAELGELGVARVSFGSGLMHIAMDAAAEQAGRTALQALAERHDKQDERDRSCDQDDHDVRDERRREPARRRRGRKLARPGCSSPLCQPTPAASVLVMYWFRLTSSRSAASARSA